MREDMVSRYGRVTVAYGRVQVEAWWVVGGDGR